MSQGVARRAGIILIILIIEIIVLFVIIYIIAIICDYGSCSRRYASISVTFGWTNVLQLLKGLTILVISSVLPCERDCWLTSRRPILPMLFSMVLHLDRENLMWKMMSDCSLVLGCLAH